MAVEAAGAASESPLREWLTEDRLRTLRRTLTLAESGRPRVEVGLWPETNEVSIRVRSDALADDRRIQLRERFGADFQVTALCSLGAYDVALAGVDVKRRRLVVVGLDVLADTERVLTREAADASAVQERLPLSICRLPLESGTALCLLDAVGRELLLLDTNGMLRRVEAGSAVEPLAPELRHVFTRPDVRVVDGRVVRKSGYWLEVSEHDEAGTHAAQSARRAYRSTRYFDAEGDLRLVRK